MKSKKPNPDSNSNSNSNSLLVRLQVFSNSLLVRLQATADMRIQDCLSPIDAERLQNIGVVFESNQGTLLVQPSDETLKLVEPTTDGSIPEKAIFSFSDSSKSECLRAFYKYYENRYLGKYIRSRVSPALSEYFWESEENDIQVEFRSPVPDFPPPGKLRVVPSNGSREKPGAEYCLSACDDGTVKWLPESECVINGSHVWTVHLFELRFRGPLYLRDRLQMTKPSVYNNCMIKTYIGWNVTKSGKQVIGPVNCRYH
ncbi:hypothetical protein RND81_10G224000 [Saponaria officinalis]|uniref:Uncharacterized protein n=1 Tax=Saponaria officinalis TaxID=3572 RepID=A0AAW1I542_SAPOF